MGEFIVHAMVCCQDWLTLSVMVQVLLTLPFRKSFNWYCSATPWWFVTRRCACVAFPWRLFSIVAAEAWAVGLLLKTATFWAAVLSTTAGIGQRGIGGELLGFRALYGIRD